MNTEKLATIEQFQNDPKLQAEFGGDYNKYKSAFIAMLNQLGIFGVGTKFGIPGLSAISLFLGSNKVGQTNSEQDKRFEEITKKLEQIKDPKVREQVAAEMFAGNLSDAFFDMIMKLYDKKKEEFEEVWAQYQLAKGQAADMKKECERLLKEYQASNDDTGKKSNYLKHKNDYTELAMNEDSLLIKARDISHRVV